MSQLLSRLEALGFKPLEDFVLQDDGEGHFIRDWLSSTPQPSGEALAAAPLLELSKARKLETSAALRWQATQTFIYNGVSTPCDSAMSALTGAVVALQLAGEGSVNWKLAPGVFVTLDLAALVAFGMAARAHIQACFDNEAALSALILAAETVEAVEAIDLEQGWPL